MALNEVAIIANPRFKVWSGRKLDKDATLELCQNKGAIDGAARVNKSLMPDEPKIKAIRKIIGEARNYHYQHTLPWEDRGGGRILPAGLYVPYQKQMQQYISKAKQLIDEFCDEKYYDQAVDRGKQALGQLADDWEYPSRYTVKDLFEAEIAFYPIPDSADFRVQLGAQEIQRLKQANMQHEREVIKKTTEHLYQRLSTLAEHAKDRLSDPKKSFHKTLTKNINHFNEIIGELNIGEDRFIEKIAQELADGIGTKDVDTLRKDEAARADAANTAQTTLEKITKQMEAMKKAQKV